MARKILCRVKDHHDTLIIYRNGTWRYKADKASDTNSYGRWRLIYEDDVPKFYYCSRLHYVTSEPNLQTDWGPDDPIEINIAETIAKALLDIEIEKMLRGET